MTPRILHCSPAAVGILAVACSVEPAKQAHSPRAPIPPDSYVIKDLVPAERMLVSTDTRAFVETVPGEAKTLRLMTRSAGGRLQLVVAAPFGNQVNVLMFANDAEWTAEPLSKLKMQGGKIVLGGEQGLIIQDYFDGAEHAYLGDVRVGSYLFKSDSTYPLTFQVVKDQGYVYLCGRGSVQRAGAAAQALGQKQIATDWLDALRNGSATQKQGAAIAMGWYRDRRVVPDLIQAIKDTSSWKIRRNAAEALGRIGDATAVEALTTAISDENQWIGAVALEALGRLGKPGLPPIENSLQAKEEIRKAAIYALGASPAAEAVGILGRLISDTNSDTRKMAIDALGRISKPACVPLLVNALTTDKDEGVRQNAVRALGQIESPESLAAVLGVVQEKSTDMRQAAVSALARFKDPRALQTLEDIAAHDTSQDVRKAAGSAVKKRKTPASPVATPSSAAQR
jgi:HEAT repeat protein